MGIKKTLSNIAGWFQPQYQRINDWDLPWLRKICQGLWEVLDDKLKKSVYNIAIALYSKYGEAKAKDIMEGLKKKFDELT